MFRIVVLVCFLLLNHFAISQQYIFNMLQKIDEKDGVVDSMNYDFAFSKQHYQQYAKIAQQIPIKFTLAEAPYVESTLFYSLQNIFNKKEQTDTFLLNECYRYLKLENDSLSSLYLNTNPSKAFLLFPILINTTTYQNFIKQNCKLYNQEILNQFSSIQEGDFRQGIAEQLLFWDPVAVKKYFYINHPIKKTLYQSTNDSVQLMLQLIDKYGINSNALYYANYQSLSIDTLVKKEKQLQYLMQLNLQSPILAELSIEKKLVDLSTQIIRPINAQFELHDHPNRFASLSTYTNSELIQLAIYSRDEIFTSTFNGLFTILLQKNDSNQELWLQLPDKILIEWISLCANYGKVDLWLNQFNPSSQQALLNRFFLLKDKYNNYHATSIANFFSSINNTENESLLLSVFLKNYKKQTDPLVQIKYQLLASLYQSLHPTTTILDSLLIDELSMDSNSDSTQLFGYDSIHTQVHFFYDDEDGIASYHSFLQSWNSKEWQILYANNFVKILPKGKKNVQLFVVQPQKEKESIASIFSHCENEEYDIDAIVHRGHSFYVNKTLNYLNEEVDLIVLGSCGGYNQLFGILNKASNCKIISTKQIGSMSVNNPLLVDLANEINENQFIHWADFWTTFSSQFQPKTYAFNKLEEYVPPHKNLGVLYIKSYRDFINKNYLVR